MSDLYSLSQFNENYEAERLQRWKEQNEEQSRWIGASWREIHEAERVNASDAADNARERELLRAREISVVKRELRADATFAVGIVFFVIGMVCWIASILAKG